MAGLHKLRLIHPRQNDLIDKQQYNSTIQFVHYTMIGAQSNGLSWLERDLLGVFHYTCHQHQLFIYATKVRPTTFTPLIHLTRALWRRNPGLSRFLRFRQSSRSPQIGYEDVIYEDEYRATEQKCDDAFQRFQNLFRDRYAAESHQQALGEDSRNVQFSEFISNSIMNVFETNQEEQDHQYQEAEAQREREFNTREHERGRYFVAGEIKRAEIFEKDIQAAFLMHAERYMLRA